jgi:hypothetical protein
MTATDTGPLPLTPVGVSVADIVARLTAERDAWIAQRTTRRTTVPVTFKRRRLR